MAQMDILARYGIKEVADVTFYELDSEGKPGAPVLYLDTLKVSTIEQTAENTSARGGKGNPELIMWDYGKEITVTLEDALFSAKSMAMMYGVNVKEDSEDFAVVNEVMKTVKKSAYSSIVKENDKNYLIINGDKFPIVGEIVYYDAHGKDKDEDNKSLTADNSVYATMKISVVGQEIVISSDKFPGTYYITGDTYARSEASGKDEFFQFIIQKAKMQSEVTLTMEAEGDPSTFNMTLKVLRPADGDMMKLVKYSLPEAKADEPDEPEAEG